jgi:hypothetical protein
MDLACGSRLPDPDAGGPAEEKPMVKRLHGALVAVLVIGLLLVPAAPARASWTVPAAATVVASGCTAAAQSADAAAPADGLARGFARFEGSGCPAAIWYFQRAAAGWTRQASPYTGRVLAVADDGAATYLLYAAADGTRITSRTHAGTFTPGRRISAVAARSGDVIASGGRWWAVWSEAAGSGASLYQARTMGTTLLRRRVTFTATATDARPSLARTSTGAVVAFDRTQAGRTDLYQGRAGTGGTWSFTRFTSDGRSSQAVIAVAGSTAYMAWRGGPWILRADGAWAALRGTAFATAGTGPRLAVSGGRFFVAWSTTPSSGPSHVFLAERGGANWVGRDVTPAAAGRETAVALTAAGGNATVLGTEAGRLWAKTQTRPATVAYDGLGAWVDRFDYDLDPAATVAALRSHGVGTLYLATARYDSPGDFQFPELAGQWLEQAHAAGIAVVGWYFPAYSEFLETDVRRTLAIASFRSPAGQAFDGLAIDIEFRDKTSGPPEFNAGVSTHLARVRAGVGPAYPIGAIVPAPRGMALDPAGWAGFPWASIGRDADVVLPMSYWSYRTDCPAVPAHCAGPYTRDNTADAARLSGLPVSVIGGVGDSVSTAEVTAFVQAARAAGAHGGSLYDFKTTAASFWPSLEQLASLR